MLNKLDNVVDNFIKKLNIKYDPEFLLSFFLKYFLAAVIIITPLLIYHKPASYYPGSYLEFMEKMIEIGGIRDAILFKYLNYIIMFTLLLHAFKSKYFGKFLLFLFSFWVGVELFYFYLQGGNTSWNIGVNEYAFNNIIKAFKDPDLFISAGSQYASGDLALKYIFIIPSVIFISIAIILKFLPKSRFNKTSFVIFLILLTYFQNFINVPYFYRMFYNFEFFFINSVKEVFIEKKRDPINKNLCAVEEQLANE
jgi:hypothetical protein